MVGCVAIVLFVGVAVRTASRVVNALRPRTGVEIYTALFGKTENECVEVLQYQDQMIPIIDYAISLHFKTCPEELSRILAQHEFKREVLPATGYYTEVTPWFQPESLGDSILSFSYQMDETSNGQYIYASMDSTEVYCVDIWN